MKIFVLLRSCVIGGGEKVGFSVTDSVRDIVAPLGNGHYDIVFIVDYCTACCDTQLVVASL